MNIGEMIAVIESPSSRSRVTTWLRYTIAMDKQRNKIHIHKAARLQILIANTSTAARFHGTLLNLGADTFVQFLTHTRVASEHVT
jgi:hypothetical protein